MCSLSLQSFVFCLTVLPIEDMKAFLFLFCFGDEMRWKSRQLLLRFTNISVQMNNIQLNKELETRLTKYRLCFHSFNWSEHQLPT